MFTTLRGPFIIQLANIELAPGPPFIQRATGLLLSGSSVSNIQKNKLLVLSELADKVPAYEQGQTFVSDAVKPGRGGTKKSESGLEQVVAMAALTGARAASPAARSATSLRIFT